MLNISGNFRVSLVGLLISKLCLLQSLQSGIGVPWIATVLQRRQFQEFYATLRRGIIPQQQLGLPRFRDHQQLQQNVTTRSSHQWPPHRPDTKFPTLVCTRLDERGEWDDADWYGSTHNKIEADQIRISLGQNKMQRKWRVCPLKSI